MELSKEDIQGIVLYDFKLVSRQPLPVVAPVVHLGRVQCPIALHENGQDVNPMSTTTDCDSWWNPCRTTRELKQDLSLVVHYAAIARHYINWVVEVKIVEVKSEKVAICALVLSA
ncbi:unnamed protein product [Heligmosomoides polygyrus]|uniref:Dynein_C domain-containing protein n=1 Tax=Heligmosomoides polygyrus TaxID=6339 RepID=A0A183GSI2_HELPZ|nr:unnamed protein product [Heligmosomoides polygyrus]